MKTSKQWHGVRLRRIAASADPDSPARAVKLPASWDARAAAAVAALAPGQGCKGVIMSHAADALLVDCPEAAMDIDTPEDYALCVPEPAVLKSQNGKPVSVLRE